MYLSISSRISFKNMLENATEYSHYRIFNKGLAILVGVIVKLRPRVNFPLFVRADRASRQSPAGEGAAKAWLSVSVWKIFILSEKKAYEVSKVREKKRRHRVSKADLDCLKVFKLTNFLQIYFFQSN